MNIQQLNGELGNIDLYLLDQLLKGRILPHHKILDAGCAEGRNLIYFLNNGFECFGIDKDENALRMLHFILGSKYPNVPKDNFQVQSLENLPYNDSIFDWLISSAVLHFAENLDHFWKMFNEIVRVTSSNGSIFIRTASDIGLMDHKELSNNQYELPDGSIRFLITNEIVDQIISKYNLEEVEPIKTVVVDKKRSMTTLVLKKRL